MNIPFKESIMALLFIVVAFGVYQYISVWSKAQEKIKALETERVELQAKKVDLDKLVQEKQKEIEQKDLQIGQASKQIEQARAKIADLQQKYDVARKSLFSETSEQKVADGFKAAYKATRIPSIRMIDLPEGPGSTSTIPYLVMPVFFAKALTDTKSKQLLCEEKNKELENIDALRQQVSDLQQDKFELQGEISEQYKLAYDEAFDKYMKINDSFIEYLKTPPKPDLIPDWLQMLAGVATGGVLCTL